MGVRCENMTPDQLVSYIKSYQEAFGLNLRVEGLKERSVFRALQKVYGKEDAGRIVKWAFYHYRGQFRDEPIGFFMFSKGNKWWTDKLHFEVQKQMAVPIKKSYASAATEFGMRSLSDL